MVGNDGVDGSIKNSFDDRLAVLFLAQRRVHAEVCIPAFQQPVGHHHIVRSGFAGHLDSSGFRLPNQLYRTFCADMGDVDGGAGAFCQHDFPRGDAVLAGAVHSLDTQAAGNLSLVDDAAIDDGQVFTMADDRHPCVVCPAERFEHHTAVFHRTSVIADCHSARCVQRCNVVELFTLHSGGDGSDGVNPCIRLFCTLQNIREHLRAIGNGFCVRHTADTGHTACRSCPTSGQDVLLMGKSRVTQMDMDVQKAGSCAQSAGIQQLCTLCNRAVF